MSLQTIHWYNIDIRIAKGSDGMKKVNYLLLILLVSILFSAKNTFAYDINNYRYRSLCGNYEVSRFNEDGSIVALSCHNTYEQAKNAMRENGEAGVAILVKMYTQLTGKLKQYTLLEMWKC